MKIRTLTLSALLGVTGLMTGAADAAIVVTNGDFESPVLTQLNELDVAGWFDSTAGTFSSFHRQAEFGTPANETQMVGLGFNEGESGFIYQSLGTLDLSDGALNWSIDQTRFGDGNGSADATLTFYSGDPTGTAADGTDIETLGLSVIDSAFLPAVGASGAVLNFTNTVTGTVDLTGLSAGTQVWVELQVGASGFSPYDNIVVTEVPEPSALALLGFGGLMMFRRRRH